MPIIYSPYLRRLLKYDLKNSRPLQEPSKNRLTISHDQTGQTILKKFDKEIVQIVRNMWEEFYPDEMKITKPRRVKMRDVVRWAINRDDGNFVLENCQQNSS